MLQLKDSDARFVIAFTDAEEPQPAAYIHLRFIDLDDAPVLYMLSARENQMPSSYLLRHLHDSFAMVAMRYRCLLPIAMQDWDGL